MGKGKGNLISEPVLMRPSNMRVPSIYCLVVSRTALVPSLHCMEISQPAVFGPLENHCGVAELCSSRRIVRDD